MSLKWRIHCCLVSFLALTLLLTGCISFRDWINSVLDFCPTTTDISHHYFGSPDADDLVIFIHGLCGDAITTWTNNTTNFVLPEELARDFAREKQPAYVVSFDYVSRLQEGASILSIAAHLEFEIGELLKKHPYRTLRIVAHSMGGLVAREYVLRSQPRVHPQLKVTHIVMLATPNNGAELAKLGQFIPSHRQIEELRHIDKGNTYLQSLNKDWNREFKAIGHNRHVLLYAGYEELAMSMIGKPVPMSSAIAYADESMPFQQSHVGIAKPKDANDVIYRWVKAKLVDSLRQGLLQGLDSQIKLIIPEAILLRLPRPTEVQNGLESTLPGTELEKVLPYVNSGKYQEALALLAESEPTENQMIENIAQRRFTQGTFHELLFEMPQAASYYAQAVQLAPSNASYHYHYGWFLLHTGKVQMAIQEFEQVVILSPSSDSPFIKGDALSNLGFAYSALGQYAEAIEYHNKALAIRRKMDDLKGESISFGNLGLVYLDLGESAKAMKYQEQALVISQKIGDIRRECIQLGNLGMVYDTQAQYDKAIDSYEQALASRCKTGDLQLEGATLGNLGLTYSNRGEFAKAIKYHHQSLAINRKVGNLQGEGAALQNLSIAYSQLGEFDQAIAFLKQALAIHQKIGNLREEGSTLGNLGGVYRNGGQQDKAIEYHNKALLIRHKIGDLRGEANSLGSLGDVYAIIGEYDTAIDYCEKALAINQKIGDLRGESSDLVCLGHSYGDLRQYARAIDYCEKALEISRKIGDLRGESSALVWLGRIYGDLGQYAGAIEFLEKAQAIYEDRLRTTFPFNAELDELKMKARHDQRNFP